MPRLLDKYVSKKVFVRVRDETDITGTLVDYDDEFLVLAHFEMKRSVTHEEKIQWTQFTSDGDSLDQILIPRCNIIFIGYHGPSYK